MYPTPLLVLLLLIGFVAAQQPAALHAQQSIPLEVIDSGRGLSHDWTRAIVQDQDGFIWIGTTDGLNRYDGYAFVAYKNHPGDSTTLRRNLIEDLTLDAQGALWVAAEGLSRFDATAEHFSHHALTLGKHTDARQIISHGTDHLWIADAAGRLYRYDQQHDALSVYDSSMPCTLALRAACGSGGHS